MSGRSAGAFAGCRVGKGGTQGGALPGAVTGMGDGDAAADSAMSETVRGARAVAADPVAPWTFRRDRDMYHQQLLHWLSRRVRYGS
ncbi:hypothetical protein SFUMM280S_07762 [Streptomyces fumanus]